MTLNIGEDEYTDIVGGAAGVRVVIHPPELMPHPEEQGVLVKPGERSSIKLSKVRRKVMRKVN